MDGKTIVCEIPEEFKILLKGESIKRPFHDWTLPQLYKHIHELEIENERLTEQAERQLEIINKMKFLDLFKDKQ